MKLQAKLNIQWRHVSTDENPVDIGTRGCGASKLSELWWLGPKWLAEREQWPDDIETIPTSETETEAKLVRDVLAIAVKVDDNLDQLMVNHTFWKAVRISVMGSTVPSQLQKQAKTIFEWTFENRRNR